MTREMSRASRCLSRGDPSHCALQAGHVHLAMLLSLVAPLSVLVLLGYADPVSIYAANDRLRLGSYRAHITGVAAGVRFDSRRLDRADSMSILAARAHMAVAHSAHSTAGEPVMIRDSALRTMSIVCL